MQQFVRALIQDNEGKFLIVKKRKIGENVWNLPGGVLADGEIESESLRRILKEEFNLDTAYQKEIYSGIFLFRTGQREISFWMCHAKNLGTLRPKLGLYDAPQFVDLQDISDKKIQTDIPVEAVKALVKLYLE